MAATTPTDTLQLALVPEAATADSSEAIDLSLDKSDSLVPADEETLRFLGRAVILEERHDNHHIPEADRRNNYLARWEIDEQPHTIWHTPVAPNRPHKMTVVTKPGWGEVIEDGIGWEFHKALAHYLPEAEIISHATSGVGRTSERIPLSKLWHHSLDQLAEQSFKLLSQLDTEVPIILVGTSMGSVITNKVLNLNIERDQPIKIQGVVYYASALVDPQNIVKDMLRGFTPAIVSDIAKELFLKTHPKKMLGLRHDQVSEIYRHFLGRAGIYYMVLPK